MFGMSDFPLGKGQDFPFLPPNLRVWSTKLPVSSTVLGIASTFSMVPRQWVSLTVV